MLHFRPLPQPGTEIGKNFPDDIFRQLRDEPGLLGQGIKISGDKKSAIGLLPAGQGPRPRQFSRPATK